jgi:hypothetical protein
MQVAGAIFGALFSAGLVPGAAVGMGDGGPGCFDRTGMSQKLTNAQIFGWEALMTFTLISVVYACGVAKPGHGSFTPLAVGLSLVACAGAGGWPGALGGCDPDPGGGVCMPAQQAAGSLLAFRCLCACWETSSCCVLYAGHHHVVTGTSQQQGIQAAGILVRHTSPTQSD